MLDSKIKMSHQILKTMLWYKMINRSRNKKHTHKEDLFNASNVLHEDRVIVKKVNFQIKWRKWHSGILQIYQFFSVKLYNKCGSFITKVTHLLRWDQEIGKYWRKTCCYIFSSWFLNFLKKLFGRNLRYTLPRRFNF